MAEAKQAIKLRQEILQLREKLNKAYTNPENQSFETWLELMLYSYEV